MFPIEEFKRCDLIYLCAPVIINIEYLPKLKEIITDDIILTDVGSVKGEMEQAVIDNDLEKYFIGGHPMAAGLTLKVEKFDEFVRLTNEYVAENLNKLENAEIIYLK